MYDRTDSDPIKKGYRKYMYLNFVKKKRSEVFENKYSNYKPIVDTTNCPL